MTGRVRLGAQVVAVGVVVALLGLLIWKVAKGDDSAVTSSLADGKAVPAPAFTLAKLDGTGDLALESLRGKTVVLNFWASWCGPCKDETPLLQGALVTEGRAVLGLVGPTAHNILRAAGLDVPEAPFEVRTLEHGFVRRMPAIGDGGATVFDVVVERAQLRAVAERLLGAGATPAGLDAHEALRVEALRPRLGVDTDERTIPHEVNWIDSAVHLDKGCYRGQETVAKVHNVGRPPRRMLLLHLDGSPEVRPETGDPVTLGERPVGRVGSVALHHELGPIALALVKRTVPIEAELLAGVGDRIVQASIDPDSVPPDTPGLGREAARGLGR